MSAVICSNSVRTWSCSAVICIYTNSAVFYTVCQFCTDMDQSAGNYRYSKKVPGRISISQVVSFKTSYSGLISMGSNKQTFRVVFDTGSLGYRSREPLTDKFLIYEQRFESGGSLTCLLVEQEDMLSCGTRRHVFFEHKKRHVFL